MRKLLLILVQCCILTFVTAQEDFHREADSILNILKNRREDVQAVKLLNQITALYLAENRKSVFDSARIYGEEAILSARKINDKEGLALALYNMGRFFISIKQGFAEATPKFLESRSLYEELGDSAGVSRCYLQLGVINLTMQYYEDALKKLQLSLKFKNNITCKYLMAICYSETDSIALAKKYFKETMEASRREGNQQRITECHIYLGKLHVEENELDSGFHYLNLAIEAISHQEDSAYLARPYAFISKAYFKRGDLKKAIYYAKISFQIGLVYYDYITLIAAAATLNESYSKLGDYPKAYFYLKELDLLKDSIFKGSAKQKVADMQSRFDYEKEINEQRIRQENDKEIAQEQMQRVKIIRNSFIIGTILLLLLSGVLFNRFKLKRNANVALEEKNKLISEEKERSDNLLLNILPVEVAEELKSKGESKARLYHQTSVLFTDFVNFTSISEQMTPAELVEELHRNFTAFDNIIEKNGLEKIKTIGDAYMAVSGVPIETTDHAYRVVNAAKEILEYTERNNSKFRIRIGIHSGPVIAGIVGVKKFAYDIWGDTVNTAARMEQNSASGKINISGVTYELVKNEFSCQYRGKIAAKNKGEIDMYFVE